MPNALADRLVGAVPERYQRLARQFLKFGITGCIGAIVDFGTYNLLYRGFNYKDTVQVWGHPLIVANMVSVLFAIISNYLFNKYWTFKDQRSNVSGQWVGYFILNLITFTINQALVSFFAYQVPVIERLFGDQRDNAAKVLAIGFILFLNFLGSKFIIFRKQPARGTIPAASR